MAMVLDFTKFKKFKLTSILTPKRVRGPYSTDVTPMIGGTPYITGSTKDNGLLGYIDPENFELNPGNCLTVISTGEAMKATYRDSTPFIIRGDSLYIFRLRNHELNDKIAKFIITLLNVLANTRYSSAYGLNDAKLKTEQLLLPVDIEGRPDWQLMEDYIDYVESTLKPIPTVVGIPVSKAKSFKVFPLNKLFHNLTKGKGPDIGDLIPMVGGVPYINATNVNQGIHSYIQLPDDFETIEGNCITQPTDGTLLATYRPAGRTFLAATSVAILRLKMRELTPNIGKFLIVILQESIDKKFSYGRKPGVNRLMEESIILPFDPDGTVDEPDWDFMENYIKEIEGKEGEE